MNQFAREGSDGLYSCYKRSSRNKQTPPWEDNSSFAVPAHLEPGAAAAGSSSALPLATLWGRKLTNSSVKQLPGAPLLWPHEHYSQNKRGGGNGMLPTAGTTFLSDSLYLCHLEVSRELHSIPGWWLRNGADLGSYSPSIIHIHIIPNAWKDRGRRSRETAGLWSSCSYSFLKLVWKQLLAGMLRTLRWWIHQGWK